MSSTQPKPNSNNHSKPVPISEDTVKQILSHESTKLQLEFNRIELAKKKQDHDAELAKLSIAANKDIIQKKPYNNRLDFAVKGVFLLILLVLLIRYCLDNNHTVFLLDMLKIVGYFATTALGYYIGRKAPKKDVPQDHTINQ
jgi:hypothetical protein